LQVSQVRLMFEYVGGIASFKRIGNLWSRNQRLAIKRHIERKGVFTENWQLAEGI